MPPTSHEDGSDGLQPLSAADSASLTSLASMNKQRPANRNCCIISQMMPIPTAVAGGRADIIGFGETGVFTIQNGFNLEPKKICENFSYLRGWRIDQHVRLLADTTGNGRLDLVGLGDTGVWIAVNNGDGTFQPTKKVFEQHSYWKVEKHLRFMADLRNTGRADMIGFGDDGVIVILNEGDGKFILPRYALKGEFGFAKNAGGWKVDRHLRFLADVTGNGFLDILGFRDDAIYLAEGNGDGTFQPSKMVTRTFCTDQGWSITHHPRFLADLNGNGLPDLIGFFWDGVYTSMNTGDPNERFTPMRKVFGLDVFGYNGGWRVDKHLIRIADLTGNGCPDIIAFGEGCVLTSTNNGDGTFQPPIVAVLNFCFSEGWRIPQHPRFVCDLTGDGRADIIGFGHAGVYVSFNDGKGGFKPAKLLVNEFGCNGKEWSKEIAPRFVANIY